MFKSDPHYLQKKLLGALALVVENLRGSKKLQPALEQLDIKHNDYDMVSELHQAVGESQFPDLQTATETPKPVLSLTTSPIGRSGPEMLHCPWCSSPLRFQMKGAAK